MLSKEQLQARKTKVTFIEGFDDPIEYRVLTIRESAALEAKCKDEGINEALVEYLSQTLVTPAMTPEEVRDLPEDVLVLLVHAIRSAQKPKDITDPLAKTK